jgi:Ca2+-binding EF-hand superfamily protein
MTISESFTMRIISRINTPLVTTTVALVALTLPAAANDNLKRAQAQTNFQAADIDKNEQMNQAEFKTFINLNADHKLGQASSVRRLGMYTKAFKKADANGDGVVTKEEIAAQAQQ